MKNFLLFLFIIGIVLPVYSQIFLYEEGRCIDGPLRIRENPTLSGEIVGRLQNDEEIIIQSRTSYKEKINADEDFWYLIDNKKGIEGYVFGSFIQIDDPDYDKTIFLPEDEIINYNSLKYTKKFELINTEIQFHNSNVKQNYTGICYLIYFNEPEREILIVTPEYEYGWIDLDNSNFINFYSEVREKYSLDNYGSNLFYLSKLYEFQLLNSNDNIKRNGPMVTYTFNGNRYDFIDSIEGRGPYYNIVLLLNEKYILISRAYYEGLLYDIYNLEKDEVEYSIYKMPIFNNNQDMFISYGTFYDGWEELNLFSISDDEINLLFEHTFEEQYETFDYIESINWINKDKIEIFFENYKFELIKSDNVWELSPDKIQ